MNNPCEVNNVCLSSNEAISFRAHLMLAWYNSNYFTWHKKEVLKVVGCLNKYLNIKMEVSMLKAPKVSQYTLALNPLNISKIVYPDKMINLNFETVQLKLCWY